MCLFCNIINGTIPSYKVYEDEDFLAILDISQTTYGHTIVLSKKHYKNVLEADDETLQKMIIVTKNLANKIMNNCNALGINILNNTNEIAGQSQMHLHFHIIPRYGSDSFSVEMGENKYNLQEVLDKILQN